MLVRSTVGTFPNAGAGPPPPWRPGIPTRATRWVGWLQARPILCLVLLTPGIPEYLSTSSSLVSLAVNPFFFFLQMAINVGQYTAGALLIREAVIRWHKGWATVFVLGLAYGITEEGLGDNTLFNSNHGTDGILGSFGRFAGVNWVWATGVLAFHVIYSIGLPILLLRLAVPSTRGRSLLTRRGIVLVLASLATSTSIETVIVFRSTQFWMGETLLIGSALTITALVLIGNRIPADLWTPRSFRPTARPWEVGAIGFGFFPIAFLLEYGFTSDRVPPALLILVELAIFATLWETVRRRIGRVENEFLLVNLAFGFVLWQAAFGVLLTLGLPYTLPLVALAVWFFVRLRRGYVPGPTAPPSGPIPPGEVTGTRGS
ncbi:MAG: hypothetical protein L3K10_03495 [Thermoplasmata archaeon]|nr:hypothetical protein [Thermoplasmata archaeon]